jgi:glycine cleavage system H lipoate-binding protein
MWENFTKEKVQRNILVEQQNCRNSKGEKLSMGETGSKIESSKTIQDVKG